MNFVSASVSVRDVRRRFDQRQCQLHDSLVAVGLDGDRHDRADPDSEQHRDSSATFNGGTVQVMGPGNIVLAQTRCRRRCPTSASP